MGVLGGQGIEPLLLPGGDGAALVLENEVGATDEGLFAVYHAGDAVGHDVLHLRVVLLVGQAPALGLLHHGGGHGVGIVLLQTRRQTQHLLSVVTPEGDHVLHRGDGVGEGTGLVEHHGIRLGHGLQEAATLDGDVIAAALPHGGEHGDGHGELQSAGEVHHQHRQHFGDVPGQQVRQHRTAQRIRYQPVRQTGGLVLGGGFQLLGLLDHPDDAVVAAAALHLLNRHHALALLGHCSGVYRTAGALDHGHGLAGDGGLIHHGLAADHLTVQRDKAAGADQYPVAQLHVTDGNQYLRIAPLQPYLVHIQGHGPGQIGHRLLVGPLLQNFAQPQHEHDGAGGGEVAPNHRDGDGGGVQHRHGELAVPQGRQPLPDVLHGAVQGHGRGDGGGEEQLGEDTAHHRHGQLVLELPVQSTGGVLRHQFHGLGLGEGEGSQCADHGAALAGVAHHGILCAVIDRDLRDTVYAAKIVFQQIRLMQRHPGAVQMYPQAVGGLVENVAFHRSV